jgi:two-component system, OmpR family, sensor histidine kinase KdpD
LRRWLEAAGWAVALAAATAGMLAVRARLNEAHVVLTYLLVVLGASASGGRAIGLGLAGAAFLLFDWFFLPPYGTLIVANPLDWLVLAAFFATSVVATQLLARAQAEAESAGQRAAEIDRLAALGAETLNAGRPEDALAAVADVIRSTLRVDRAAVYMGGSVYGTEVTGAVGVVEWVLDHGSEAAVSVDGTMRLAAGAEGHLADRGPGLPDARTLLRPLSVRGRIVGVLGIERSGGLALDPAERRVLDALSYYAALGVERVRLVAEAQHAEALRQADALKDALLASVSHDLRTPLTTIKALAHDLAVDAEVADDRAATIEEEADRLNRFVGDLLDLSRIQAATGRAEVEANEAEDLVGAALQRATGALGDRPVHVSLDPAHPVLIGRFNFTDALRALVNLLDNAAKHTPQATPIELDVRRDGSMIAFAVSDHGPGVAAAEAERIFAPFYRPPGVAPDTGGAGLGLSIARSLAEAQGGRVTYEPRPGGGSVFTLQVPLLD